MGDSVQSQEAIAPTWSLAGYYFNILLDTVRTLGGDGDRLLRRAGPAIPASFEQERHYPLALLLKLLRLAADECQDPDIGLHFVMEGSADSFGLLGVLAKSAGTLRDAWTVVLRYRQLVMNLGRSRLIDEPQHVCLAWYPYSRAVVSERFFVDAVAGAWIVHSSAIAGRDIRPVEVSLTYPRPVRLSNLFHRVYGRHVSFGQPFNCIRFKSEDFEATLRYSSRTVFDTLSARAEQDVRRYIKEYTVVESLESYLETQLTLSSDMIDITSAARALNLSVRTLQRRLSDGDTSFNQLLANLRHNFALRYLQDHRLTVTDVALKLGYSQVSSFCTAFRGWTGQSPSEYRESVLGDVRRRS